MTGAAAAASAPHTRDWLLDSLRNSPRRNLLTITEQRVLAMRLGVTGRQPRTLAETGTVFGLTPAQVRRVESRAMALLRGHPCVTSKPQPATTEPG